MARTVVHVTTLDQWKSVLDVWFKQGYKLFYGGREYNEPIFERGVRFLNLDDDITWTRDIPYYEPYIEYIVFVEQQKEGNKMAKVYEVSQAVFDRLQMIKAHEGTSLIGAIALSAQFIQSIAVGNKAILRYLSDDPDIEFKVKEQLYRLWSSDEAGNIVYMMFGMYGTPTYTPDEDDAFTAPLEEIKKHKTISWEIEEAD